MGCLISRMVDDETPFFNIRLKLVLFFLRMLFSLCYNTFEFSYWKSGGVTQTTALHELPSLDVEVVILELHSSKVWSMWS